MAYKSYLNGVTLTYATPPNNLKRKPEDPRPLPKFKLGFKQRMKVHDAVVAQQFIANQKNNLNHNFLTMTYEAGKDIKSNLPIKKFFDNLYKNAGLVSYVWVKELTKKKTIHYHSCFCSPRITIHSKREEFEKVLTLNKAWCSVRGSYSSNAVRTGEKGLVVHDLDRAKNYISKYISKCSYVEGAGRVYGMSENLIIPSVDHSLPYHESYNNFYRDGFMQKGYKEWVKVDEIENEFVTIRKTKNMEHLFFGILKEQHPEHKIFKLIN